MISTLPPPPARPAPPARRRSPGIWIGVALIAVGGLAVVGWLVLALPEMGERADELHRAKMGRPVEFEVVDDVVEWDVFIEPSDRSQSGVRYEIRDADGELVQVGRAGEPGSFLGASGGSSYSWFGRSGRSIASARLQSGTYRLEVVSGDATIAIGRNPAGAVGRAVGGAAALGLPLILGGTAVAVVSAVRDTRRRNRLAEPPPPSPWSSGEWPGSGDR